ncbi:MAG TPA: RsmE family RNA methyltransferase [Candidatus Sulfotelmatobacter sp.]|jgi:16S rRNA (uracil1498-N3)-methyltransferase|nr:RsmE family RNA methyltransferase [Candidatus Sulfotelmatobacter sp.]
MTRRRWIADEVSGSRAALVGEHAEHLVRVLRARVGQDFDIATGEAVRRGRIVSVDIGRVEFDLAEEIPVTGSVRITLLLSIFKFDRMEWAIEKCTELGVAQVIPVIARRTDSHLAAAAKKRVERWQRIALQSAEQSRRITPPEIADPSKLADVLNTFARLKIVLTESEDQTLLRHVVRPNTTEEEILLAVGPEGGWTDDELQSFQQAGWTAASLGNTILRAETAAIAATAVMISLLAE